MSERQGPENRVPIEGETFYAPGEHQIGWAYIDADGRAVRVEVTDPLWVSLAGFPRRHTPRPTTTGWVEDPTNPWSKP